MGAQRFESSAAGHRSVWPTSAWAAPHSNRYAPTASPAPRSSRFAGRSGDRSDSRSGNDTRTSLPRSVGILSSWGSSAAGDPPQLGILRSWGSSATGDPPQLGSSAAGILRCWDPLGSSPAPCEPRRSRSGGRSGGAAIRMWSRPSECWPSRAMPRGGRLEALRPHGGTHRLRIVTPMPAKDPRRIHSEGTRQSMPCGNGAKPCAAPAGFQFAWSVRTCACTHST